MAEMRELTLTDKRKLEEELAELNEAKKRVAEEIKVARGFGDLSENAEYDEAKAEEARVYGRISEIEQTLHNATFVDDSLVSAEAAAVGTVVTVQNLTYDEEEEYTIVGFTEVDPFSNFISNESPIGMALLGIDPARQDVPTPAHVGDIVEVQTPGGAMQMKLISIRRR